MELLGSDVLADERYLVPPSPPGDTGLAWLRAHVTRFCDGPTHARRRALTDALLAGLTIPPGSSDPTAALLCALDLPEESAAVKSVESRARSGGHMLPTPSSSSSGISSVAPRQVVA